MIDIRNQLASASNEYIKNIMENYVKPTHKNKLLVILSFLLFPPSVLIAGEDSRQFSNQLDYAIVLDYELLGDTSLKGYQQKDAQMMENSSIELRKKIDALQIIDVMDDPIAVEAINTASETYQLHRCNGCELTLAKQLGASYVIVPWVFRMSILIQTMYLEVRDVESGKVIVHLGRNFRGNTQEGWQHAMDSLVRDINAELMHIKS